MTEQELLVLADQVKNETQFEANTANRIGELFRQVIVNRKKGDNGKSAYDIWLENGHSGSVQDFLNSLQGGNGSNGLNGKSAYELWLDNGGTGTVQDFLTSLIGEKGAKGNNGTNGKSAYQTWIDNGHTGTETEFLDSLKGADGDDGAEGKSAYQIWLDLGNTGSKEDFLRSLSGKNYLEFRAQLNTDGSFSYPYVDEISAGGNDYTNPRYRRFIIKKQAEGEYRIYVLFSANSTYSINSTDLEIRILGKNILLKGKASGMGYIGSIFARYCFQDIDVYSPSGVKGDNLQWTNIATRLYNMAAFPTPNPNLKLKGNWYSVEWYEDLLPILRFTYLNDSEASATYYNVNTPSQIMQAEVVTTSDTLSMSNKGLLEVYNVTIPSIIMVNFTNNQISLVEKEAFASTIDSVDLSVNMLTEESVDNQLEYWDGLGKGAGFLLDMSGGTNAAPSAAGLVHKQALIDRGATITTN